MAVRGPQAFMNVPELIFFENARQPLIVASLMLRRKTILANPEWKSIPWSLHPERKTAMQTLYDIMADCPEKSLRRDCLLSTPEMVVRSHGQILKLLTETSAVLVRLAQWKESWDFIHPDAASECAPSLFFSSTPTVTAEDDTQIPAWTTILVFKSDYEAIVMGMYNATKILLISLLQSVLIFGQIAAEEAVYVLPEYLLTRDARQRAIKDASFDICRSVEYNLQSTSHASLSLSLLFPLRMAYTPLEESYPSICAWLRHISSQIANGQRGRWAAAKNLLDDNAT